MFGFNRSKMNKGFASACTEACSACRPSDDKNTFLIIMDAIILASISLFMALVCGISILRIQALAIPVLVLLAVIVLIAAIIMAGFRRTAFMYC